MEVDSLVNRRREDKEDRDEDGAQSQRVSWQGEKIDVPVTLLEVRTVRGDREAQRGARERSPIWTR